MAARRISIQQQQQHSLLSQASWGRLKMKPKRPKNHGSSTLIASLQVLLSKATSLEIFQSLRSLLTDSSQVSLDLPLPLFTLSTHFRTPLRTGASGGLRWTCPNHLSRCWISFSSIGAIAYPVYHHFELDPSLYAHKSNATCAFLQHLIVRHAVFL